MTSEEAMFLVLCESAFLDYVKNMSDTQNLTFFDTYQDKMRKSIAGMLLQVMEDYFRYYDSSDENLITEEQFYEVLRHFNNILGTNLYINIE